MEFVGINSILLSSSMMYIILTMTYSEITLEWLLGFTMETPSPHSYPLGIWTQLHINIIQSVHAPHILGWSGGRTDGPPIFSRIESHGRGLPLLNLGFMSTWYPCIWMQLHIYVIQNIHLPHILGWDGGRLLIESLGRGIAFGKPKVPYVSQWKPLPPDIPQPLH